MGPDIIQNPKAPSTLMPSDARPQGKLAVSARRLTIPRRALKPKPFDFLKPSDCRPQGKLALAVSERRLMSPDIARLFTEGGPAELLLPDCTLIDPAALATMLSDCATPRCLSGRQPMAQGSGFKVAGLQGPFARSDRGIPSADPRPGCTSPWRGDGVVCQGLTSDPGLVQTLKPKL